MSSDLREPGNAVTSTRSTGNRPTGGAGPTLGTSPTEAQWRLEVGRFRAGCPSRTFPMGVHVGEPDGARVSFEVPWPVPGGYDTGLRFDLLSEIVAQWSETPAGATDGWAWLTRQGAPVLHDQDALWHAAAVRAFGAHEIEMVSFRVVTKTGWLDVRTGESRTWKRLRL